MRFVGPVAAEKLGGMTVRQLVLLPDAQVKQLVGTKVLKLLRAAQQPGGFAEHAAHGGGAESRSFFASAADQAPSFFAAAADQAPSFFAAAGDERKSFFAGAADEQKSFFAGAADEQKSFFAAAADDQKSFFAGAADEQKSFFAGAADEQKSFFVRGNPEAETSSFFGPAQAPESDLKKIFMESFAKEEAKSAIREQPAPEAEQTAAMQAYWAQYRDNGNEKPITAGSCVGRLDKVDKITAGGFLKAGVDKVGDLEEVTNLVEIRDTVIQHTLQSLAARVGRDETLDNLVTNRLLDVYTADALETAGFTKYVEGQEFSDAVAKGKDLLWDHMMDELEKAQGRPYYGVVPGVIEECL